MLEELFLVGVGILIGWTVLPRPIWAKLLWEKAVAFIKAKSAK